MRGRGSVLLVVSLLLPSCGYAKDKNKSALPAYVLQAHTITVIIDPGAGVSIDDPQANRVAQADVETAFHDWGRFEPVIGGVGADLIVVLRKGSGRMVNQTVSDPRQNRRGGTLDPYDSGISAGAQRGQQPGLSSDPGYGSGQNTPRPQSEIGEENDSFAVYQGGVEHPLDSSPAWRYMAKDALRPHTVPAVAEFRKALAEAEKAAAKKP